jgi:Enoyl-(Acyl carrier protein) reductase
MWGNRKGPVNWRPQLLSVVQAETAPGRANQCRRSGATCRLTDSQFRYRFEILDAFSECGFIHGGCRFVGRRTWSVAICYRLSEKEARETIVSAINRGVRGSVEQCDASDPKAVADFAESVEKQWGPIDPLINCAGTIVSTRSRNGRRLVGDVCHQSSSGILSEPGVRYSPSRKAASAGLGTGKMASLHATKDLKTF